MRDKLGESEDGSVEKDTRERQQSPPHKETGAVDEKQKGADRGVGSALDLVVCDAHVAELAVVHKRALAELDNPGVVLVLEVSLHEVLAELDDLAEGEVLARDTVEAAGSLDNLTSARPSCETHLEGLPVGGAESDGAEGVVDLFE